MVYCYVLVDGCVFCSLFGLRCGVLLVVCCCVAFLCGVLRVWVSFDVVLCSSLLVACLLFLLVVS